jgi:hypothetical protein
VNALRHAKATMLKLEGANGSTAPCDGTLFERQLNCEPLIEGWTWHLQDRADFSQLMPTKWEIFRRKSAPSTSVWARMWIVIDLNGILFFSVRIPSIAD